MSKKFAKTKRFRVATEGATTDGRVIDRVWIQQMAEQYDPKTYGARVNLEHYRGIDPQGLFKAYGDVTALSAEEVDSKLCLFAVIAPTEELILLTQKKQKVYTSIEVNPNFADTGKAYLVGLAITDSPASLGTEMLEFSAKATVNPLAARKQDPANLFTAAVDAVQIEFEEEAKPSLLEGFSDKIKALLGKASANTDQGFAEVTQAIEVIAASQKAVLEKIDASVSSEEFENLQAAFTELQADLAEMKTQMEAAPTADFTPRPPASGGQGKVVTDC